MKVTNLVLLITICFFLSSCDGAETSSNNKVKESASKKISYSAALERAKKFVDSDAWLVASISNTGVMFGGITSNEFNSAEEGLMDKNGNAGQWVVEFYKNNPKVIQQGGKKGFNYPARAILVTSQNVRDGAATNEGINVPKCLAPLDGKYHSKLLTAFQTASSSIADFDIASVGSSVSCEGLIKWHFRFYDFKTKNIVAKVVVNGNGEKIEN